MNTIITREIENTKNDFMRFQVGRMETRPEQSPIYSSPRKFGKLVGLGGNTPQNVFRLLGFGSTEAAAQAMANLGT